MTKPTRPTRLVCACRKHNRGFTLIELTVVIAVLGILLATGIYGFSRYLENANGSACSRQLADISRAVNTICAIENISNAANIPVINDPRLPQYLGGKTILATGPGAAGDLWCPGGQGVMGTYTLTAAFIAGTTQPVDPTCSLGGVGSFANTSLHSLIIQ